MFVVREEFRRELLELGAPLGQRLLEQRFAVCAGEKIEDDEERRMRRGQFLNPAGGGMKAKLKFVEGKKAADRDNQFAVEHELFRLQFPERAGHIGKVTGEGLAGLRLQKDVATIAEGEAAKPVPFRLVLPVVVAGDFVDRARFHRRDRRLE